MRETSRARRAWVDYLAMGEGRSLGALHAAYVERGRTAGKASAPTARLATLEQWSRTFGWQARLEHIADQAAAATEAAAIARRREAIQTGLALDYERIIALKELAADAQRSLAERFDCALIQQLRGVLDDIAKEVGGRQRVLRVNVDNELRAMADAMGVPYEDARAEFATVVAVLKETGGGPGDR